MSDPTTLDPEGFAAAFEAHLKTVDGMAVQTRDSLTLQIQVGQSNLTLNLHNFYNAYAQQPGQFTVIAEMLVRALRNHDTARTITSFDQIRTRVYPMLKPISLLVNVRERNLPMLVYRPFLADLIITYVIDEPTSVAYINEQHLERWGIAEHELHEPAMANLRRRTEDNADYTVTGEGATRLMIYSTQDGFDATRLLMPDLLEHRRAEFPGNMVIGIPNRDFLIIFSDADREILTNVANQIQLDATQREHGLTDQLFMLQGNQIREYVWE